MFSQYACTTWLVTCVTYTARTVIMGKSLPMILVMTCVNRMESLSLTCNVA